MGKPWKELEKKAAEALGGTRINRALDYGESNYDVAIPDFDFLAVDAKFRKRHAHHALIEEIRDKYCEGWRYPVLVTKHHRSRREYVTVDLALFGAILDCIRKSCYNLSINAEDRSREEERVRQGMAEVRRREDIPAPVPKAEKA